MKAFLLERYIDLLEAAARGVIDGNSRLYGLYILLIKVDALLFGGDE